MITSKTIANKIKTFKNLKSLKIYKSRKQIIFYWKKKQIAKKNHTSQFCNFRTRAFDQNSPVQENTSPFNIG